MSKVYADKDTPWRDAGILRELYVDKGMTTYEVAEELGCSDTTVSKWLDEHDIRHKKSINKDRPWKDEERVRELYEERRLTVGEVAEELNCSYYTAYQWMKKHGIERRDNIEEMIRSKRRKPPCHRFTRDGYEVVQTEVNGSTKQVPIHRLVMVAECGFDAVADSIVHHKNGIPSDNRPENLEVMSAEEHGKLHKPVEVRWGNKTPSESHEVPDNA